MRKEYRGMKVGRGWFEEEGVQGIGRGETVGLRKECKGLEGGKGWFEQVVQGMGRRKGLV